MELNVIKEKIGQLRTAEGQAKTLIAELIVAVTERIHEHNDVDSANSFLTSLSALNQKRALSFLKLHAGHKTEQGVLTKRKPSYVENGVKIDPYQEAHDKFGKFKDSGLSFWQWAVLPANKVDKPVTLDELSKKAAKLRESMQEGMEKRVVDKVQAFELLTGGLFSFEDMQQVLAAMANAEDALTQAAKASLGKV